MDSGFFAGYLDASALTPAHGHANTRIHRLANRQAAIDYLMPMATRHGGRTGKPLSCAVAAYAQ
jgi:hypothetical protein